MSVLPQRFPTGTAESLRDSCRADRWSIEGEMGDQLPGLQARLMSQALRKLTGNIKRSNTLVIFINQLRMKIGVMMPGQSPEPPRVATR